MSVCRHHFGLSPSRGLRHEQYIGVIGVSTGYLAVPVSGGPVGAGRGLCYSRIESMLTSMQRLCVHGWGGMGVGGRWKWQMGSVVVVMTAGLVT